MNKKVKLVATIICILSLIVPFMVGFERLGLEATRKQYDIAVKYTDVLTIARQNGHNYEEVLRDLKQTGVNVLFVPENRVLSDTEANLASYKAQGQATVYSGYDLMRDHIEVDIIPEYNYIWCLDQNTQETIYGYLSTGGYNVEKMDIGGERYIQTACTSSQLMNIGVGFNEEDMAIAADLGFTISPQMTSPITTSEEGIKYAIEQVAELPNLGPIYFMHTDLSCFQVEEMYQLLHENGIGYVEFFSNKQAGFGTLVKKSAKLGGRDFKMYRLHTLTDGEVDTYSAEKLYERFELGLTERNLSYFLFKLPKRYDPEGNYEAMKEYIQGFRDVAAKNGYTQGDIVAINMERPSYVKFAVMGLASVAVFVLICCVFNAPVLGTICGVLGFLGYLVLLKMNMLLACRMMGLFTAICFPTYAVIRGLQFKAGSLLDALKGLVSIFLITAAGAVVYVGTAAHTELLLGVDWFMGTKVAFILPILIVLAYLIYEHGMLQYKKIKEWAHTPITYFVVALLAVGAVVLLVYLSRSGNNGSATALEIQMRQILKDIFGTRPRTKEFLISYPLIMCLIYFGYNKLYIALAVLASVGPISLLNTFTHNHTPLMISIQRSGWGLVLGAILGIVLIYIVKGALKIGKNVIDKLENT